MKRKYIWALVVPDMWAVTATIDAGTWVVHVMHIMEEEVNEKILPEQSIIDGILIDVDTMQRWDITLRRERVNQTIIDFKKGES